MTEGTDWHQKSAKFLSYSFLKFCLLQRLLIVLFFSGAKKITNMTVLLYFGMRQKW